VESALALDGTSFPAVEAKALNRAGRDAREAGDYEQSATLLEASLGLYRSIGDLRGIAYVTSDLAEGCDDPVRARHLYEEAIALCRQLSLPSGLADAIHSFGEFERDEGNYDRAAELLEESLSLSERARDLHAASYSRHGLADLRLDQGELEPASDLYRASLEQWWIEGDRRGAVYCIAGLAAAAAAASRLERAGRLWGAVERFEEAYSGRLTVSERTRNERRLAALDQTRLAGEIERGRAMTLEEAVDLALSID
jgi:tetratricopeptide (TPR) repeat protein